MILISCEKSMKLYLYDIDEARPSKSGDPHVPQLPFRMLLSGSSGSGKTNMLINLLLGDKLVNYCRNQDAQRVKSPTLGQRYINCNDVLLVGKHLDEPKWRIVREFYKLLAKEDGPLKEDVTFTAITPDAIPPVTDFDSKRSTVVVFEDLVNEPKKIQQRIAEYFTHGRHRNISPIYVSQRFFATPKIIRENLTYIALHSGAGNLRDIKRIISQYTEHSDKITPIIDNVTRSKDFVVFDLTRSHTDPLAIRHRWDLPLIKIKDVNGAR